MSGVNMSGGGQHSRRGLVGTATWQKVVVKCGEWCVLNFQGLPRHVWMVEGRVTKGDLHASRRNGVDCLLYVMRNARITDDAIAPCTARKDYITPQYTLHTFTSINIHEHT